MSRTVKIIKRMVPLQEIMPPMIFEIIQEHITKYVKDHQITKYNVEFGYIEESVMIDVEDDIYELSERSILMSYQAKVIEAFLFNQYGITRDVYTKVRNKEIIRYRQLIQFFMVYYSGMSLAAIGMVTGKQDHATVLNSKNKVLKKIREISPVKKEIFMLDRTIALKFGISSKIFDINTNLIV